MPLHLLGIQHGYKYKKSEAWYLTTMECVFIAKFATEEVLEKWWCLFQESQGRDCAPLELKNHKQLENPGMKSNSTGKREQITTKVIFDVDVPLRVINLRRGRKFEKDGFWYITTYKGVFVAKFSTQEELEKWWHLFEDFQERVIPLQLVDSKTGISQSADSKTKSKFIFGVYVPLDLLDTDKVYKYRKNNVWHLVTAKHVLIARFSTEEVLEKWWGKFQESQGRIYTRPILVKIESKGKKYAFAVKKDTEKRPKSCNPTLGTPKLSQKNGSIPRRDPDQVGHWGFVA